MVNDALNRHASFEQQDNSRLEESPNEATQRFYNLLAEANQPVFEGVTESKLSICLDFWLANLIGTFPSKH